MSTVGFGNTFRHQDVDLGHVVVDFGSLGVDFNPLGFAFIPPGDPLDLKSRFFCLGGLILGLWKSIFGL